MPGYNSPCTGGGNIIPFCLWVGIGRAGTPDVCNSLSAPGRIQDDDLPMRRSDEGVCRHDRRTFSDFSPRAALEILMSDSVPQLALHLAAVQDPGVVGRVHDS